MELILHKNNSRGFFDYGWLVTRHTFSFARYYDPERVNFGALRVLNDDIIKPAHGFGKHPHDNMEIITIPLTGSLLHRDSMGHEEIIKPGEVQVMSAGTGVFHEEYNASDLENASLLQIWIFPKEKNIKPVYNQMAFDTAPAQNQWQKLVTLNEPGTLHIHQNAVVSRIFLEKGKNIEYQPGENSYGSYLFIIEGEISINGYTLEKRDGTGITGTKPFNIRAESHAQVLNIEIPN
ncbi:MAG: pirin family protein [Bacteroidales bacterium]|nr:pirin family protein [Bacteroidales bacterium]